MKKDMEMRVGEILFRKTGRFAAGDGCSSLASIYTLMQSAGTVPAGRVVTPIFLPNHRLTLNETLMTGRFMHPEQAREHSELAASSFEQAQTIRSY